MTRIREVWAPNLEAEMNNIRDLIDNFPYVAMDTEFPGVVARPIGNFKTSSDYHYQTMRCNVDLLKIIQVGITLANEEGEFPQECSTWQFNFRFSLAEDMFTPDSVEQLQKAGIDFQRHEEFGIIPNDFAELMITSGMVLSRDTRWISFHRYAYTDNDFYSSAWSNACLNSMTARLTSKLIWFHLIISSGYDFGYFVKLLTAESLPTTEDAFFALLKIWFPTVYDIKYMTRAAKDLKGGLQDVADYLGVMRIGASQQAGSDSLLTASTFFKIRERYFDDQIDDSEYSGKLYGLGQTFTASNGLSDPARGGATIAEREDRGSARDVHNQTPGPNNTGSQQSQNVNMSLGPMSAGMQPGMTPGYGPMGNGPPSYMRTMVGGGR